MALWSLTVAPGRGMQGLATAQIEGIVADLDARTVAEIFVVPAVDGPTVGSAFTVGAGPAPLNQNKASGYFRILVPPGSYFVRIRIPLGCAEMYRPVSAREGAVATVDVRRMAPCEEGPSDLADTEIARAVAIAVRRPARRSWLSLLLGMLGDASRRLPRVGQSSATAET